MTAAPVASLYTPMAVTDKKDSRGHNTSAEEGLIRTGLSKKHLGYTFGYKQPKHLGVTAAFSDSLLGQI